MHRARCLHTECISISAETKKLNEEYKNENSNRNKSKNSSFLSSYLCLLVPEVTATVRAIIRWISCPSHRITAVAAAAAPPFPYIFTSAISLFCLLLGDRAQLNFCCHFDGMSIDSNSSGSGSSQRRRKRIFLLYL